MKKLLILGISLLAFAATAQAQSGGVAVLDIDKVAEELGVEDSVKTSLVDMQNDLNSELQKAQANLQAQMKNAEEQAGENPTDEAKRQLIQTNQQLNVQFNQMKAQAQQQLANERVKKISDFREQIRPYAMEAAKAKGLDVVLMKVTPPVFDFSESVDITAATTELAKKAGLGAAPAPAEAEGEKGKKKE